MGRPTLKAIKAAALKPADAAAFVRKVAARNRSGEVRAKDLDDFDAFVELDAVITEARSLLNLQGTPRRLRER